MKRLKVLCSFLLAGVATLNFFPTEACSQAQEEISASIKESKSADSIQHSELRHTRMTRDEDKNPLSLDVAITSFVKDGVTVDLVGVVHIGEKEYYQKLNQIFTGYDKVLYELVAAEGTKVSSRKNKGGIHTPICDILGLESQLEFVDYDAKNFVHADLSPSELGDAMREGGQSVSDLVFSGAYTSYKQQLKDPVKTEVMGLKLVLGFFSPKRDKVLKTAMAEQFADLEESMQQLGGDIDKLLIKRRNTKALEVLKKELGNPGNKRIAIFYGAGHNYDFANRLEAEFGMKYEKQVWLTAWDL